MTYKTLGDYIRPVNIRNKELEVTTLLGVSIKKVLMPSIANTIGTNMKTYKIIKRNQFAYGSVTSRNGDKISIALLQEHKIAIVSQAYTVFEVIDENEVLPEYLMMWFRRPEFDRYARFKSHGSARETFDWDELCETKLPIPSIEKQQQIVDEYNTVTNRIKLNEQLNKKLEETAQALYKHWFVDFEFPNAENKPYKSSGGKMVYNEELDKDIPVGWCVERLENLCEKITKGTTPNNMYNEYSELNPIKYIKGESINLNHSFVLDNISYISRKTHNSLLRSQLIENDICYSIAGSLDKFTLVDSEIIPANTNQAIAIIRVNNNIIPFEYVFGYFISSLQKEYYEFNVQQAVQANLSLSTIGSLPLVIPDLITLNKIKSIMQFWIEKRDLYVKEQRKIQKLQSLLLAKMTKIEAVKEINY